MSSTMNGDSKGPRTAKSVSVVELDQSLEMLAGELVWDVKYGLTNLSMEFGQPHIRVIHEPNAGKDQGSNKGVDRRDGAHFDRRRIAIKGQWSLWVYDAQWRIVQDGKTLTSRGSSARKMTPVLAYLQGQRFVRMTVDLTSGFTRAEFDLGVALEVRRRGRASASDLWLLYGGDGHVRAMRGDGTFTRESWQP